MATDRERGVNAFSATLRGGCAAALLLAGCTTTQPDTDQAMTERAPLNREQLRKAYEDAKDPRQFWITVYPSENGPVFSGTQRLHESQLEEISFDRGEPDGGPVITFRGYSSASYTALIDTTSADNWTDFASAASMGAALLGLPGYTSRPTHVRDDLDGYLFVMDRIRMEGIYVDNALFFARGAVGSLGPLARGVEKPRPTAVLGMRFLQPFSFVRIDFKEKTVSFASTRAFEPRRDLLVASVPIEMDAGGALGVKGSVNGRQETILIDTAGAFHVALKEPEEAELRHLSLGDLVFRHLPVTSMAEADLGLEDYPRVGLDVLSRFTVIIDNAAGMVHFERPAT